MNNANDLNNCPGGATGGYVKCEPTCCYGTICFCTYYGDYRRINGTSCTDVNECEDNNGFCDGTCTNQDGSYSCSCPQGYQLGRNGRECDDVDECLQGVSCPSNSICINTLGGYHCVNGLFAAAQTGAEVVAGTTTGLTTNAVLGIIIAAVVTVANVALVLFLTYNWARRERKNNARQTYGNINRAFASDTGKSTVNSFNSFMSKFSQKDADVVSISSLES